MGSTYSTAAGTNSAFTDNRRFGGPIAQESEAGMVSMISQSIAGDKRVEMAKNETI